MQRIRLVRLDALRGLAVSLMVCHHFLYDLVWLFSAPSWLFSNPFFDGLRLLFVGIFVGLSGVSCRFSRTNGRRGVRTLAAAMTLTAVTVALDAPIYFGILHLLGVCMLVYALVGRWVARLPGALLAGAGVLSLLWVKTTALRSPLLWVLGVPWPGLISWDYFPLVPWLFVFFLGAKLGARLEKLAFVERRDCPLAWVGRRTLWIYLLHQPVLFLLLLPLWAFWGG